MLTEQTHLANLNVKDIEARIETKGKSLLAQFSEKIMRKQTRLMKLSLLGNTLGSSIFRAGRS